jgi:hypothetical protein
MPLQHKQATVPSGGGLVCQNAEGVQAQEMGPTVSQEMGVGVRGDRLFKPQDRVLPLPVKRHLKVDFRERQIHSSNPSLQLPSDMADYRLAAERLRQFGIRRNEQREDMSGFVTLKQFMLSRQEEEKRQSSRPGVFTACSTPARL